MIDIYVKYVQEKLEKERNELEEKNIKKGDKRISKLINNYDKEILESYKFIEDYICNCELK